MYRQTQNKINYHQKRLELEKMSLFNRLVISLRLFIYFLFSAILHSFYILFTPPDKSFVLAYNPDPSGTWSRSYYEHLLYKRRMRLFSSSSFFAIIIAVVSCSLILNIIFPPKSIQIAHAATYTVTNTNNTGVGSLRQAIIDAAANLGADTISFTVDGTITLTTGSLSINDASSLDIDATGHNITIDANNGNQAIVINGGTVTLTNLIITNSSTQGIKVAAAVDGLTINGGQVINHDADGIDITQQAGQTSSNFSFNNVTITGNGQTGLHMRNSSDNTTVSGCTISSNTVHGLDFGDPVTDLNISNTTVDGNGGTGINFNIANSISGLTLTASQVTNNGTYGISADALTTLENVTITSTDISNNGLKGFLVQNSVAGENLDISNNTINDNLHEGLGINGLNNSTISNNTISGNGSGPDAGVYITGDNNTISDNTFSSNGYGLTIGNGNSNIVSGNDFSGHGTLAIELGTNCTGNQIINNTITNNGSDYAIKIGSNCDDNLIDGNTLSGTSAGIHIDASDFIEITNNIISYDPAITLANGANEDLDKPTLDTLIASSTKLYLTGQTAEAAGTLQLALANTDGYLESYLSDVAVSDGTFDETIDLSSPLAYSYLSATFVDSDGNTSPVTSELITLDTTAPEVTISVSADIDSAAISMSAVDYDDSAVASDPDPLIYYTTDGSTPTTASTLYSSSFTVTEEGTIKAIAVDYVDNTSAVASEEVAFTEEVDTTPPVISAISVAVESDLVTIVWITDEAATSQILYGTVEDNLYKVKTNADLVTSHSLELTDLESETTYYFKVKSVDAAGNVAVSAINDFTTEANGIPVILQPQAGQIIYLRRPTVTGTAPAGDQLKLKIDDIYQGQGTATASDTFSIKTENNLSADQHQAKVRNVTKQKISAPVNFVVGSQKTTDRILVNRSPLPVSELNTTLSRQPLLYGNFSTGDFALANLKVQVFIDNQLNGLATLSSTSNQSIGQFKYYPFLNLLPGSHTASIRVLHGSEIIEQGAVRTFVVYGYPAPILSQPVDNQIPLVAKSNSLVRIYIDGQLDGEVRVSNDPSGTASYSYEPVTELVDYAEYTITATARPNEQSPESKQSNSVIFVQIPEVVPGPTPAPTTPPVEEPVEEPTEEPVEEPIEEPTEEPIEEPVEEPTEEPIEEPTEEPDSDDDGLTDEEEDLVGTDPEDADSDDDGVEDDEEEEIIEQIGEIKIDVNERKFEEIAKDIADQPEVRSAYPIIGREEVPLTPAEKEDLKQQLTDQALAATIKFSLADEPQTPQTSATGLDIYTYYDPIDLGAVFKDIFTGQESEPAVAKELVLSGTIPSLEKLQQAGVRGWVILTVNSDPVVHIAQAAENGAWTISVPVDLLDDGEHTAFLQTEINGIHSGQVEIARFVLQEKQKLSNTTIFFIVNVVVAVTILLLAIFLQLRKNRQLIEEMRRHDKDNSQAPPPQVDQVSL